MNEKDRDHDLLAGLLGLPDEPTPPAQPATRRRPAVRQRPVIRRRPAPEPALMRRPRSPQRTSLRRAGIITLMAMTLAGLLLLGSVGYALLTIRQNLQAMRMPTAIGGDHRLRPIIPQPAGVNSETPANPAAVGAVPTPTLLQLPARLAATPTLPPAGGPMTVLLLGIDRRPDESGPARADTIMVARVDPLRGRIALLSLPRDLVVTIPGYGQGRINSASVYGELNPALGGGSALTRKTVATLLSRPIDYVVLIDFQAFIAMVDAIGGVDIDVERDLYDPQYPTMDYGYTEAYFPAGLQHMDGATALIYSRMRHMDSDFERMHRQQSVVLAVMARLREQNIFQRVQSVAAITTALRGYVQTDLPEDRIPGLVWAFRNLTPEGVERYTLDASMIAQHTLPDDSYAEIALPGAIERLARQLVDGPGR